MSIDTEVHEFTTVLSIYSDIIRRSAESGLNSPAKNAEYTYARLLNALYGWSVMSGLKTNEAAIDLVGTDDQGGPIVVQVTATCTSEKVNKKTLENPAIKAWRSYRLKFVFVGDQKNAGKAKGTVSRSWIINNRYGIPFDRQTDMLFTTDLINRFQKLEPYERKGVLELAFADIGTIIPRAQAHMSVSADLVKSINSRLERQRDSHPSFQLMSGSYDPSLSPYGEHHETDGIIPNAQRIVKANGQDYVLFRDFLRDSWSSDKQNHLFITGRGGVGKTVAMLTFATEENLLPAAVPAMYIPLHDLAQYTAAGEANLECIDRYLKHAFSEEEFDAIERLSYKPWSGGPRVILLLDGHNEIPADNIDDVEMGVRAWAERSGTQLVTTSRAPGLFGIAYTRWLELQPLSKERVRIHLERSNIHVPDDGNTLWQVLETPLMLRLYEDVESIPSLAKAGYLQMEPSDSASHLIWNYLQRELWRLVDLHKGNYSKIEYATAILLILPFVCQRMESAQEFMVNEDKLDEYVDAACNYWLSSVRPSRFSRVERRLRMHLRSIREDCLLDSQLGILKSETGLFRRSAGGYVLLHQNFRDGLAAIHLRNIIDDVNSGTIPMEFRAFISEYVKDYLADLCEQHIGRDNPLLRLWETSRNIDQGREGLADPTVTHNLLRIIHRRFDGNLTMLNWSGMDLRGESLFPYRKADKPNLMLSTNPSHFSQTHLAKACFLPKGHTGEVNDIAFSTDGMQLATCSGDGSILLWDLKTGRLKHKFGDCGSAIETIRFSPNTYQPVLASGSWDGAVQLWDPSTGMKTGKELGRHGGWVESISFSESGDLLASGSSDGTMMVWHLSEEKRTPMLIIGDGGWISSVCLSPDGSLLASGSGDGKVRLWNPLTGRQVSEPLNGHHGWVIFIRFFRNGTSIISGSDDGTILIWSLNQGKWELIEQIMSRGNQVRTICLSPNEALLATGLFDGSIIIRNLVSGNLIGCPFDGQGECAESTCFSPDSTLLAVGFQSGTVRIWNHTKGVQIGEIKGCGGVINSICFSPSGALLASGSSDGIVRLWHSATRQQVGALLDGYGSWIRSVSFSPSKDEDILAIGSSDGRIQLWALVPANHLAITLKRHIALEGHEGRVESVCFSPDGTIIASGSDDGTVRLWNTKTGSQYCEPLKGDGGWVTSVCISPDSTFLAFGTVSGNIYLCNLTPSDIEVSLLSRYGSWVRTVGFSPTQPLLVSGSHDGTVQIWDIDSSYEHREPLIGHKGWVRSVCFSPDGTMIASSSDDGTVKLWNTSTGTQVATLRGSGGTVGSVCFSINSEGHIILSCGSFDGIISMWDISNIAENKGQGICTLGIIEPLFGILLEGLDFSQAYIDNPYDCAVLIQNGVKLIPEIIEQQ